jgi:hypothetical protein
MTDTSIFGELIQAKKPLKVKTTKVKPCKSFETWVKYMQFKNKTKIQVPSEI